MAEHIPEDVIAKIFQRLPVKSLIRFTSVSKRWRLIILQDPHFAASHYRIASHNKTLRHSVCFRIYLDSDRFFESQTTLSSFPIVKRDLCCPFKKPHSMVLVYCSCRGLTFAVFNGEQKIEWFIWNPSTGLSLKLPDHGGTHEFLIFTGFGYVSATHDYKILIANSGLQRESNPRSASSRRNPNLGGRIQDSPYSDLSMTMAGILCHEALHWLGFDVIVAFDLANEEFRTMPLPAIREEYGGAYFRNVGDF